jgi:hypothetical protein
MYEKGWNAEDMKVLGAPGCMKNRMIRRVISTKVVSGVVVA